MIVAYSPKQGFFIGCEPAGFGGVEGDPLFRQSMKEALDLSHGRQDETIQQCHYHLGYIHKVAPDAVLLHGTRTEIRNQATVLSVMES
jgi:hypothetical protein